jgi:hypothetical protein
MDKQYNNQHNNEKHTNDSPQNTTRKTKYLIT